MSTTSLLRTLAAVAVVTLVACRAEPPVEPPSPPPLVEVAEATMANDHVPDVRFIGQGADRVLIDGYLLWTVGEGVRELGLPEDTHPVFSSSGRRVAAVGETRIWTGDVGEEVVSSHELGLWVRGVGRDGEPLERYDVRTTAFWLDDHRLYVGQMTPYLDADPVCRVLDASGDWSAPVSCVTGEMYEIYAIEPAAEHAVVISSVGEGHPAVEVATYDTKVGQTKVETPALDLYPSGPATLALSTDGKTLHVASPCRFGEVERPCLDVAEDASWRWYVARLPGGSLKLKRDGLPAGFAPSADGATMAWGKRGAACVGQPEGPSKCVQVSAPRP